MPTVPQFVDSTSFRYGNKVLKSPTRFDDVKHTDHVPFPAEPAASTVSHQ